MSGDENIESRAATQFAVLRGLCYPDEPATSAQYEADTFTGRTRTHAKTDGHRLKKINRGHFQMTDAETRFVTLLHEVSHASAGSFGTPGKSAHRPEFWEAFQKNFNAIADEPSHRRVVESLFRDSLGEFDWHRARYRAVQQVSQVDKRSETVDERKRKMADAIGYDGYEDFENADWGVAQRRDGMPLPNDPVQVNLFVPMRRYADEFSDDELLAFIEEQGGVAPSPLLVLDIDDYRGDGPQIVRDDDLWSIARAAETESKKALAVQERIGRNYHGLDLGVLAMAKDPTEWSRALPIPPADVPRGRDANVQYSVAASSTHR